MNLPLPEPKTMSYLRQNLIQVMAFLFWVALIATFWVYIRVADVSILMAIQQLIDSVSQSTFGLLLFILFYVIQPILFFPSSLLTIAAGYLYGPFYGTLISVVGSNGAASLAYFIGRYFGLSLYQPNRRRRSEGRLERYTTRLQKNSFTAVLIMRLIYLPYDPISYLAGFLRIKFWPYVLGTFLGSLVGNISFALFGASVEGDFTNQMPSIDPVTLVIAIALSLLSIVISRFIQEREETLIEQEKER